MTDLGPTEIARMAALARLDVDPRSLPELAKQIERILEYVSQLPDLPDTALGPATWIDATMLPPLRTDERQEGRPTVRSEQFAPEFEDGFFLVPRPAAMDDE